MDKLEQIKEALKSVLCDPEGNCCISGSDADREVVNKALKLLDEHREDMERFLNEIRYQIIELLGDIGDE